MVFIYFIFFSYLLTLLIYFNYFFSPSQLQETSHSKGLFRIYNDTSLAEEIQTWALNLPKLLCELKTNNIESIETSQVYNI